MTETGTFDFSVIIPHANAASALVRLLKSIQRQETSRAFEVLVISNPPGRDEPLDPDEFSFPLRILESPRGANAARQRGAEAASSPLLIFLDDDCWLDQPGFLQRHWELHQENPDILGFGGFYRLHPPKTRWGELYNETQNRWLREHRLPLNFCVHLLGGNSSYKKTVFEREGFDTGLLFGGTETEFQVRLYHRKMPLRLSPELSVAHEGVLGLSALLAKAFKQGLGSGYISSLHQRPPRFLFGTEETTRETAAARFGRWLYRLAFEAGEEYFRRTRKKTVSPPRLWLEFSRRFLRPETYGRTGAWRRLKSLYAGVTQGLLSSGRSHGKDSSRRPGPPKNRS